MRPCGYLITEKNEHFFFVSSSSFFLAFAVPVFAMCGKKYTLCVLPPFEVLSLHWKSLKLHDIHTFLSKNWLETTFKVSVRSSSKSKIIIEHIDNFTTRPKCQAAAAKKESQIIQGDLLRTLGRRTRSRRGWTRVRSCGVTHVYFSIHKIYISLFSIRIGVVVVVCLNRPEYYIRLRQ